MFHTILTLAYLLPNIYVFVRIGRRFVGKEYRYWYALIYLLVALVYPVGNLLVRGGSGFFADLLSTVSGYLLPFYLYLFLSVLAFDLFLLLNLIIRVVPAARMESRGFKKAALAGMLLLSLGVVVAGAINFNTIRLSPYTVEVPRKASRMDHLKIAFVADFHLSAGTDVEVVERFAQKIALVEPDLLIFGGDIVEGNGVGGNLSRAAQIIRGIHPGYGVFGVMGNHEHYGRGDRGRFFEQAGIRILADSVVVIDRSFNLAGRRDGQSNRRMNIGQLLQSVNDSLPVILVDHRPTEIDQVSRTTVDVQLSGHTHDGQLFPINLIVGSMYPLSWGHEKIGHTHFFVTSGIRLWGPPVRTAGKSEIMVIDLRFTP